MESRPKLTTGKTKIDEITFGRNCASSYKRKTRYNMLKKEK